MEATGSGAASQNFPRRPPKEVSFLADKLSRSERRKMSNLQLSVIFAVASQELIRAMAVFHCSRSHICTTKPSQGLSCESVPDLNYIFESLARVYL